MANWQESLVNLPTEQWDRVRLSVERFEQAWNNGDPPPE